MDGVIVDFVKGTNKIFNELKLEPYDDKRYAVDKKYKAKLWKTISQYQKNNGEIFWKNMPKMQDADELLSFLKDYSTEILTATGRHNTAAANQKREWVKDHVGTNIKVNVVNKAEEKRQYAKSNHILIDDRTEAINPWIDAGGIGILHKNATDTIKQLKQLGL